MTGTILQDDWAAEFYRLLPRVKDVPQEDPPMYGIRANSVLGVITSAALDGQVDYDGVSRSAKMSRAAYRMAVLRAKNDGLMDDDGALTQLGRWHGICNRLGVGMSELCVLSDMYVVGIILRSEFGSKLYRKAHRLQLRLGLTENGMSKIYRTLREKKFIICRYGHGYKYVPETAYMNDRLFSFLHRYMWDMMVLKKTLNMESLF